jgi:hypothetical protein
MMNGICFPFCASAVGSIEHFESSPSKGSSMASITLTRYEAEHDHLPRCCMVCGAPAAVTRTKAFSWNPSWVYIFLFCGLLPLIIIALVMTKKMKVFAPLCEDHQGHWSKRTAWTLGGLGVLALFGIGSIVLSSQQPNNPIQGVACIATVVLALAWVIMAIALQSTSIHPTEITDRNITLDKVSPIFVDAVREARVDNPELTMHLARSSGLGIPIVALVFIGCLVVVVLLAAISVLGEKKGQPGTFQNVGANVIPINDAANHFTLNSPGPGWNLVPRAQLQGNNADAFAGAEQNDGRVGLVLIETVVVPIDIEGNEDDVAQLVLTQSPLTNKRLVRTTPLKFQGQPAVRVQFLGSSAPQEQLRVDTTLFMYQGKLYQVWSCGPIARTAEDGSSFQPFINAFVLHPAAGGKDKK